MKRGNLGKGVRYLVALGTLVSVFALFACGGGDDTKSFSNLSVPLTSSTVVAVQGVAITIPNSQTLGTAANSSTTLTFNPPNFTLLGPGGQTASGTVIFGQISTGSCTFNVPFTPGFIQVATTVTFTVCNLNITASNVEKDGDRVPGTLNLVFSGLPGTIITNNVNADVFIDDDDNLFVVNPVNGQVVATGVQP